MTQHEQTSAELIAKREVLPGTFHFVLAAPSLAAATRPGQFVMLQPAKGTDPLLRRPLCLCGAGDGTVELLFQVKGSGTRLMAAWEPGRSISLLGPLGNGFTIPETLQTAVLIAGGIGAAPLLFLAKRLLTIPGINREFYFGSKTGPERSLVEDFLPGKELDCFFVSEDGSGALHGLVTGVVARHLEQKSIEPAGAHMFSCGPGPMLKKVAALAQQYGLPCQVSLEARMACGVGACLGCAATTIHGYRRVCADGPVFNSTDIIF